MDQINKHNNFPQKLEEEPNLIYIHTFCFIASLLVWTHRKRSDLDYSCATLTSWPNLMLCRNNSELRKQFFFIREDISKCKLRYMLFTYIASFSCPPFFASTRAIPCILWTRCAMFTVTTVQGAVWAVLLRFTFYFNTGYIVLIKKIFEIVKSFVY